MPSSLARRLTHLETRLPAVTSGDEPWMDQWNDAMAAMPPALRDAWLRYYADETGTLTRPDERRR